jgi:carbon monoxide dehydrogenase subunit G
MIMSQERIEVGKMPHIEISECHGDLVVRSWAETAVLIKGDDCEINETETGLSITIQGSAKLTIPTASSLTIGTVHGDFTIKKLDNNVSLQSVMGDAALRQVASAKIGTVHGDLQAKHLEGSLSLETVMGDMSVSTCTEAAIGTVHGDLAARNIEGNADIVAVMGDINLRNVAGDVSIKQGSRDANLRNLNGDTNTVGDIAGDIRLYGPLNPGVHSFTANGDIVFHWPADEPVTVTAVAPQIKNKMSFSHSEEDNGILTVQIDDGGPHPQVTLKANGQIVLKRKDQDKSKWVDADLDHDFDFDFDFDFEGFSEKINEDVFAQVNRITADFENRFGPDFAETLAIKAEKEASKIEKAAERAMRQAERAMREAERKMKQAVHHRAPAPPRPPMAPHMAVKSKPKVSSEEQLKILKMVEKGIISPDEAGTLLQALEN